MDVTEVAEDEVGVDMVLDEAEVVVAAVVDVVRAVGVLRELT